MAEYPFDKIKLKKTTVFLINSNSKQFISQTFAPKVKLGEVSNFLTDKLS